MKNCRHKQMNISHGKVNRSSSFLRLSYLCRSNYKVSQESTVNCTLRPITFFGKWPRRCLSHSLKDSKMEMIKIQKWRHAHCTNKRWCPGPLILQALKKWKCCPTLTLYLQYKMGFHHVTWSIYKQSVIFWNSPFCFKKLKITG